LDEVYDRNEEKAKKLSEPLPNQADGDLSDKEHAVEEIRQKLNSFPLIQVPDSALVLAIGTLRDNVEPP
jgi:hypothetical protein